MKGNDRVIAALNSLLADELTAINQYTVHGEMAENWGYEGLHKRIEKRALQEMRHAERLIARILFLEGRPVVSELRAIAIGSDVPAQLKNDHALEAAAIKGYNDSILLAGEVRDFATREILEEILRDEDHHIDEIEEMQDQVGQMSVQVFLSTQVRE